MKNRRGRAPDGSAEDCAGQVDASEGGAGARRRGHQRRAQQAGDAQGHGGDGLSRGTAAVGPPQERRVDHEEMAGRRHRVCCFCCGFQ